MLCEIKRSVNRGLAMALVFIGCTVLGGASASADYPDKPVTIMVAWGAGGATDVIVRSIQPVLARELGNDVVIKNVPGAAGTIGTAQAARAKPDGYTILISPAGPLTTQPHMRKVPYDLSSFDAIGRISLAPMVMMVAKDSAYHTLDDIVSAAKAGPGELKVASAGTGSLPHIAILAQDDALDIQSKHVPFKGSAPAMKGLMGGVVDVINDQVQLVAQYELRPIVVWSGERLSLYPDTPTMRELGYDYDLSNWVGMFAPKGTPDSVREKIEAALAKTLSDPAVEEAFDKLKVMASGLEKDEFDVFLTSSYEQNGKYLKAAGLGNK